MMLYIANMTFVPDAWRLYVGSLFIAIQSMMARQAYYDIICGTYVIYDNPKEAI
jgi:hypothetical protein